MPISKKKAVARKTAKTPAVNKRAVPPRKLANSVRKVASKLKKGNSYKLQNGKVWTVDAVSGEDYKVKDLRTKETSTKKVAEVDRLLADSIVKKL